MSERSLNGSYESLGAASVAAYNIRYPPTSRRKTDKQQFRSSLENQAGVYDGAVKRFVNATRPARPWTRWTPLRRFAKGEGPSPGFGRGDRARRGRKTSAGPRDPQLLPFLGGNLEVSFAPLIRSDLVACAGRSRRRASIPERS